MARRSDHPREELEAMAVEAGSALLAERGLAGFSAREVGRRIGYTVGTVSNLFGGVDGLMLHVNARTLDALHERLKRGAGGRKGSLALHALARAYTQFSQQHRHGWAALFDSRLDADAALPGWYREKMQRLFTLVEEILLTLSCRPSEAKRSARILWAGIHGISVLATSGKLSRAEAGSAALLSSAFIDNYIRGITRR